MAKLFTYCFLRVLCILNLIMLSSPPGTANPAQHALTVFIECTTNAGHSRTGSGVIVSETGHVLTARHIVSGTQTCTARRGSRLAKPAPLLQTDISESIPAEIDMLIMQIADPTRDSYPYATICKVSPTLERQFITSLAFSRMSKNLPSATRGIIANTNISPNGIVEVDLHLSKQRSGGPIFLEGQTTIIGIVAGVTVDPLELLADTFNMTAVNPAIGIGGVLSLSPHCNSLPQPATLSDDELASWKSLEPGNCDDLRRHLGAFPNGGYSTIAEALIVSEQIETVDEWKSGQAKELQFIEFNKHPQETEAAARNTLVAEISQSANAKCSPFNQATVRLGGEPSARYDMTCTTSASGATCEAEGFFICPILNLHSVTTSQCGEVLK